MHEFLGTLGIESVLNCLVKCPDLVSKGVLISAVEMYTN